MTATSTASHEHGTTWKGEVRRELDRAMDREARLRAAERAERMRSLQQRKNTTAGRVSHGPTS